jgi:hypothetical protein
LKGLTVKKVEYLTCLSGNNGVLNCGDTAEVSDAEAARLVERDAAKIVADLGADADPAGVVVVSATAGPAANPNAETATAAPRGRGRPPKPKPAPVTSGVGGDDLGADGTAPDPDTDEPDEL